MSKSATFITVVTLATLLTVPVGAQQKAADAPSEARVKELIEQAQAALQTQGGSGQKPMAATVGQGPRVDLTEDEAVARALERNVTLASQRLTPQTFDYQIAATRAFYRPTVTSMLNTQAQTQLGRLTTEGGDKTDIDNTNWNGGLTQNLPWGGASLTTNWNNNRQKTTQNTATFNPSYTSNFSAQYIQPLLAGRKVDNTRTTLATTAISQDIAELDLQATTASTVAQVRNAYWELVYAVMNLENQRLSLDLASKLVSDNRSRVEIGTMAPIDVIQAQAEEATRRQSVVNAEATLQNNELTLKRLIVSGTDDPVWTSNLNPSNRVSASTDAVDLEGAVRNALQGRTDLQTARKNIESSNVTLRSLNNQTLPTLNLQTTYRLDGRGGRPSNADISPTNWFNALGGLGTFDAPTWTVQFNFSYPIGTSQAEANKARQEIILRQQQTTVKATELQIATEVTAAAIAIRNSQEAIRAATAARELSEQRAQAAQSKLEVGMATNFEVVQAQRDLADARNRELREQLNLRRAVVDFQRVQVSPR